METAMNYLPENYTENVSSRSLVELVPVLPSPRFSSQKPGESSFQNENGGSLAQFRIRVYEDSQ